MSTWKWHAASVQGFDHKTASIPCQDAHAVKLADGDCLVAIVSDGAGSACRADYGATRLCEDLGTALVAARGAHGGTGLGAPGVGEIDLDVLRQWVEQGIDALRVRLTAEAQETAGSLSDFHATLVGAIADRSGGAFFHIGDGAAVAASSRDLGQFTVSAAANGEYSNETFFFTMEEWRSHLRLTRFGPEYDLLALMSDGVTPFALAKGGAAPFRPFFEPVSRFLADSDAETGHAALVELLERDALRAISGDDKSLVWARRSA
ncbi:PP2C family serine/threonine-protein phosphatase [soil metagenome]